jgi:protein arginine N-methyltransferase 3
MLKDKVRTDAYRDFIYDNKHLFAGKVVLDVGCGTGILSMFCAKAGAAQVIAVDNSDIIDKARANILANKLDKTITCIRGKIEEITLPVKQVDIIVSEWMGYCLLFEAMLDSVLWARDKYLKPEGLMVPSHTVLHLAPISDEDFIEDNIDFWRNIYGFDMSAMQEKIFEDILVRQMPNKSVAGSSHPFVVLPLHEVKTADLVFIKDFEVILSRDIQSLDGWLVYFDTFFLTSRDARLPTDARAETWSSSSQEGVAFTTGPQGKETHWKSGVMISDRSKVQPKALKAGASIKGTIEYRKGKENSRGLEIDVKWQVSEGTVAKQTWFMK